MAKGDYTQHSDYNLIVIVEGEELGFKEGLLEYLEYSKYSDGWMGPLTYILFRKLSKCWRTKTR